MAHWNLTAWIGETFDHKLCRDREGIQGGNKGQRVEEVRLEMQGPEIPNQRNMKRRWWCGLELGCGSRSAGGQRGTD